MTRQVDFEFNGRSYTAFCPAAAVFDIYEKWPASDDIAAATGFMAQTREGWDACCWLVAEFARWGELYRRQLGETPRAMLTVAQAQMATAAESVLLRGVVADTLVAAFRRDVPDASDDEEVDLILRQLDGAEKKTPPQGSDGPVISRRAPSV